MLSSDFSRGACTLPAMLLYVCAFCSFRLEVEYTAVAMMPVVWRCRGSDREAACRQVSRVEVGYALEQKERRWMLLMCVLLKERRKMREKSHLVNETAMLVRM